ncbi:hypothetical protein BH23CHL2_BH23CHL2_26380 [soil metagenome]
MASDSATYSTANLDRAARRVPTTTVNAATRLLQTVARHREGTEFVTDILNVLTKVAATSGSNPPDDAGSDYLALVEFLERPEVLSALRETDPLISARIRGLRMREQLLAAGGGVCSAREFADALGITRQAIDKRRRSGTLIGVSLGKRGYMYPVWQIGLDGLGDVLAELQEYDPWTQLAFVLSPNRWLDGQSPLDVLKSGEIARATEAAHLYGEQVAA